jgi:hypothetical protein
VVEKAQKLWDATKPDSKTHPAYGYSAQTAHEPTGFASFNHKDQPAVDR